MHWLEFYTDMVHNLTNDVSYKAKMNISKFGSFEGK